MLNIAVFSSTFENTLQLLALIVVFILILFAAYYCTRFIGKYAYNQNAADNIKVIETFHLSQAKYVQILKIGKSKYIAVAICKDTVEFLTELNEDELELVKSEEQIGSNVKFADILKKIRKK
jgi:flagellar protein FliO/FliZ